MGTSKKLVLPIFSSMCYIDITVTAAYWPGSSLFILYPSSNNEIEEIFPKFKEQHKKKRKNFKKRLKKKEQNETKKERSRETIQRDWDEELAQKVAF